MPFPFQKSAEEKDPNAEPSRFGKKSAKKRFGKKARKAAPIQKSMMQSGSSRSMYGGRR